MALTFVYLHRRNRSLLLFVTFVAFLSALPAVPLRSRPGRLWPRRGLAAARAACMVARPSFWPVDSGLTSILELRPMSIDIQLNNALSKQNIRVSVPSTFTIGVTTDAGQDGQRGRALCSE